MLVVLVMTTTRMTTMMMTIIAPSPTPLAMMTLAMTKAMTVCGGCEQDRLTMVGLLYAMLDFTRDEKTFEAYDRMTVRSHSFLLFSFTNRHATSTLSSFLFFSRNYPASGFFLFSAV